MRTREISKENDNFWISLIIVLLDVVLITFLISSCFLDKPNFSNDQMIWFYAICGLILATYVLMLIVDFLLKMASLKVLNSIASRKLTIGIEIISTIAIGWTNVHKIATALATNVDIHLHLLLTVGSGMMATLTLVILIVFGIRLNKDSDLERNDKAVGVLIAVSVAVGAVLEAVASYSAS